MSFSFRPSKGTICIVPEVITRSCSSTESTLYPLNANLLKHIVSATNSINQKCYLSEYNRVVTLYSLKHKYQTIIVRAMTRRLNGY